MKYLGPFDEVEIDGAHYKRNDEVTGLSEERLHQLRTIEGYQFYDESAQPAVVVNIPE